MSKMSQGPPQSSGMAAAGVDGAALAALEATVTALIVGGEHGFQAAARSPAGTIPPV